MPRASGHPRVPLALSFSLPYSEYGHRPARV